MLKIRLVGIATLFLIATVNAMETPNDDNNNNNRNALALTPSSQFNIPKMSTVLTQGSHLGSQFNRPRSSSTTQNDPINRPSTIKQIFKQKGIYIGGDALEYLVQKTKKDTLPTLKSFVSYMAEDLFARGEISANINFCSYACEKKFQTEVIVQSMQTGMQSTKTEIETTNTRLNSLEEKNDALKKAIDKLIEKIEEPKPGITIHREKSSLGSNLLLLGTLGLVGYSAIKMQDLQNNNADISSTLYKMALKNAELEKKLLDFAAAATPKAAEVIAKSIWSSYCTIL